MKLQKIPMGKVEKWLVDEAKKVGLDIDGFEHEITNHFVNHVMKEHGDEKAEATQGQIAIKKEDFEKIPDIVKSPDYVMVGGKYTKGEFKGNNFLAYAKNWMTVQLFILKRYWTVKKTGHYAVKPCIS
jgi:hypothetical protein